MQVNQISQQMQDVFLHQTRALSYSSGFCQRTSLISGSAWVQGLVFGWLADPSASLSALTRSLAVVGAFVTPQALEYRFSARGAALLKGTLEAMTQHALGEVAHQALSRKDRSWLEKFPAIWLRDSTRITVPAALQEQWPNAASADSTALKVSVKWEWHSGLIAPLHLSGALCRDQKAADAQDQEHPAAVIPGEMHVFDLGYFSLRRLSALDKAGAYFCCRFKAGTWMEKAQDQAPEAPCASDAWALLEWLQGVPASVEQVEWRVLLGKNARVPVRFLAQRVPPEVALQRRAACQNTARNKGQRVSWQRLALCGWTLLVTNAPASVMSLAQAQVLYRMRWQIERLFRLWKETLQVDKWRSTKPFRILCELYAKLIGALLTQELTQFCAWDCARRSLVKCAHTIRAHAQGLLTHLRFEHALKRELRAMRNACFEGARTEKRKQKPATFQRICSVNNP